MIKYLVILILIFLPAIQLYSKDYHSMDRKELLYELLVAKKQLKAEILQHKATLNNLHRHQIDINRIASEKNSLLVQISYLESEIGRLQIIADTPYQTGDIELAINFNAGTSLILSSTLSFFIFDSFNIQFLTLASHPDYLWHNNNWGEMPFLFAGIGISYKWKWKLY